MSVGSIEVRVTEVQMVSPIIKQFTLSPVDGGELPPFSGGSHVIVVMPGEERTFRNPYSLLSSPRNLSHYQIAVRRDDEGRGGSLFMHEKVEVGSTLQITHPVNLFPLSRLGCKHVLIAGGVGITPIMAMVADLDGDGAVWELHYAVRSREHAALGLLLIERYGERVQLYFQSNNQFVDFEGLLSTQTLGTHVYTCGPAGMIEAAEKVAQACGWPDSHIHSEKFSAPPVGEPFVVRLAKSNASVRVPPERSMLEALEAAGIEVPYLCRGGVCGKCETKVLEVGQGLVHNDHWLSPEEKASCRKIMPCVSRARAGQIVVDL